MTRSAKTVITPESFNTFGDLLHYLRRRARLTQQDLANAMGYSTAQVCRFEQNRRLPNETTVAALFVPALGLQNEPEYAARLMQLVKASKMTHAHQVTLTRTVDSQVSETIEDLGALEDIPAASPLHIARDAMLDEMRRQLRVHRCIALVGMPGLGKTALGAAIAREHTAEKQPVFWLTLTAGVTDSVDAIVRQLALFLVANGQARAEVILRERGDALMRLDQKISLIGAGLAHMRALLCFDNVYLIQEDDSAVQVLNHLIASTPSQVLFISRHDLHRFNVFSVPARGLEQTEAAMLVARIGGNLAPDLTERLWTKTGGSPMLIRLAIGHMHDARINAEKFIAHLENQPQVEKYLLDVVLHDLPANAARLASLLSVFRQPVDLSDETLVELLDSIEGKFDYRRAAAELQRRFLIENRLNASLHRLVRDHFYDALASDLPHRRRLHRIAAEWWDARGDIVEAAFHYFHAGRIAQAVDILSDQGEALFSQGHLVSAVQVVEEILAYSRLEVNADARRRLLLVHGDLLLLTRRAQDAESDYREALAIAETENAAPTVRADTMRRLAARLSQRGQREEAYQMTLDALNLVTSTDTLVRARLTASASARAVSLLKLDEASKWAGESLQLAKELEQVSATHADEIRTMVFDSLAMLCRYRGDYSGAIEYWRHTGELANQLGMIHTEIISLGNVGGMLFDTGHIQDSLTIRQKALERARALGDSYAVVTYLVHLANNYRVLTDYKSSLEKLDEACALANQMNDAEGLAFAQNQRATVLIALGRVDQAYDLMVTLIKNTESWLAGRMRAYFREKLAVTQMLQGKLAEAQETLTTALEFPVTQTEKSVKMRLQTTLALALLADGESSQVASLLEKPPVDVPLWMEVDRQLVLALFNIVQGKKDEARIIASQVAEQSRATGLLFNAKHADAVLNAIDNPPPLIEFAKLMWS